MEEKRGDDILIIYGDMARIKCAERVTINWLNNNMKITTCSDCPQCSTLFFPGEIFCGKYNSRVSEYRETTPEWCEIIMKANN